MPDLAMKFSTKNSAGANICCIFLLLICTNLPKLTETSEKYDNTTKRRKTTGATSKLSKISAMNAYNLTDNSPSTSTTPKPTVSTAGYINIFDYSTGNSTVEYIDGNYTSNLTSDFPTSENYAMNFSSNPQNLTSHYTVPIGYIIGMSGAGVAILSVLVIIGICWRRQRAVLLPEHSIYTVQETTGWDNISLHYIDNPADLAKDSSWDDLSDDSYLASLDEVIAQRASINLSKRSSGLTSSTVSDVSTAKRISEEPTNLKNGIANHSLHDHQNPNSRTVIDNHVNNRTISEEPNGTVTSNGATKSLVNGDLKTLPENSEDSESS